MYGRTFVPVKKYARPACAKIPDADACIWPKLQTDANARHNAGFSRHLHAGENTAGQASGKELATEPLKQLFHYFRCKQGCLHRRFRNMPGCGRFCRICRSD
ncbi:MAG: hypothetical protein IPM98_14730 [Lewinellaceae bacterium]|nr:hypothetical protein [Lewinellaceae bacterium]